MASPLHSPPRLSSPRRRTPSARRPARLENAMAGAAGPGDIVVALGGDGLMLQTPHRNIRRARDLRRISHIGF